MTNTKKTFWKRGEFLVDQCRRRRHSNNSAHKQKHTRRPLVELLESRRLMANLSFSDVFLRDGNGDRIETPVIGEQVAVQAAFVTQSLPSDASYRIEFKVDGVPLSSPEIDSGAGVRSDDYYWWRSGWFATPGTKTVTVTLDADNTVQETDETDNTFTFQFTPTIAKDLPQKFIWPVEGEPQFDQYITNYADLDPDDSGEPDQHATDFKEGFFTYNGHTAWDIGPGNFAAQDEGIDVYAAAEGTVIEVSDGAFDRQEVWVEPAPAANFVRIDHGHGWITEYYHLRRDSIQVRPGQRVHAGDVIGLVGSSGFSSGTHLHFAVKHHGFPVEPMLDPTTYLVDAPVYSGDRPVLRMAGATNYDPGTHNDYNEFPSTVDVFKQSDTNAVYVWAQFGGLKKGDNLEYAWYRPDGTLFTTTQRTINDDFRSSRWSWKRTLPVDAPIGTWSVEYRVNGDTLGQHSFDVAGIGKSEILVRQEAEAIILDGRVTPVDFGAVDLDSVPTAHSFKIENHGSEPLTIGKVDLPFGFQMIREPASTIAPGTSTVLAIELDTSIVGYYAGDVTFSTNDASEQDYNFAVEGRVRNARDEGLIVGVSDPTVEPGSRTVARVRRTGSTSRSLDVLIEVDDPARLSLSNSTVTIPAGEDHALFFIDVTEGSISGDSSRVYLAASAISVPMAPAFRSLNSPKKTTSISIESIVDPSQWRMDVPVMVDGNYRAVARNKQNSSLAMETTDKVWRNLLNPEDVNNDGAVSAADALTIINELNLGQYRGTKDGILVAPGSLEMWPEHYFDVNGDHHATAADALAVINRMELVGSRSQTHQGEQTGFAQPAASRVDSSTVRMTESPLTNDRTDSPLEPPQTSSTSSVVSAMDSNSGKCPLSIAPISTVNSTEGFDSRIWSESLDELLSSFEEWL